MKLDEYLKEMKEKMLKEMVERMKAEAREWVRRNPVQYYKVFVTNRVTRERWVVELETREKVNKYLESLARPGGVVRYMVYEVMDDMYDIGPYRVEVLPIRKRLMRRGVEWHRSPCLAG